MKELLNLVDSTEKLLSQAEKQLQQIKEMEIPENLSKRVSSLVEKHNHFQKTLKDWKENTFNELLKLAIKIDFTNITIAGKTYGVYTGNGRPYLSTIFNGFSEGPLLHYFPWFKEFIETTFSEITRFLKEKPKELTDEITRLTKLAQQIGTLKKGSIPK